MTKLRDEFLHKKPDEPAGPLPQLRPARRRRRAASAEETQPAEFQRIDQERPPAAPKQTVGGSIPNHRRRRGPRAAQSDAIVVSEVLPPWGPLKRYEQGMDHATYEHSVEGANWTYAHMKAHKGGPEEHLGTWTIRMCMDMLDICGYSWIYMDIYGPPGELIQLVVLDQISIQISIHIHLYPYISIKGIQIYPHLYPKIISIHYPCGYPSRYPLISIFHLAYPCVFK